ncbi:hypothetical protein CLM85_18550 [Streptomyces albidoflavus]|uniref:hypothetical protein n=1 Tax=Streptomyces albidoflavus TaxID=1886 RepID=UPI000BAE52A8|nr:hypothetical protein [Streptomyces albidoflavus]PAX85093.1 hypothetical protein CLM82_32150 [Streptomyces albidoflavus]PAX89631.1 hypothetical protein CLM82_20130 [Streptomyces albidoflavus]PBO17719.1 hypothetical protein CLM83_16465 [Streptomyces albidoflavus]PBO23026.1 hypothetical protein CLM85_18550 [Streptomyces albidoflavus]PBO30976.1 hypothetical protein CLM84_05280 [Streptomyces albidoflavus]
MTTPTAAMPDIEQVAVAYLRSVLPGAVSVGTEWPAQIASRLAGGVVSLTLGGGGSRLRAVTADRTLDIDILAATKKQARDLAALVSARLITARGTVQGAARIYEVDETSLIWLPYQASAETDPIPRYVLVMSSVVRPA